MYIGLDSIVQKKIVQRNQALHNLLMSSLHEDQIYLTFYWRDERISLVWHKL